MLTRFFRQELPTSVSKALDIDVENDTDLLAAICALPGIGEIRKSAAQSAQAVNRR